MKKSPPVEVTSGSFTKTEAARRIVQGVSHLHSGKAMPDTFCEVTKEALAKLEVPTYTWEQETTKKFLVHSSEERASVIEQISKEMQKSRRGMRDKLGMVLEELLTNSVYHAYRHNTGKEKYARGKQISLRPEETVEVGLSISAAGIYLKVIDRGGSLNFKDVVESFARCYQPHPVIQNKEGGAGLGIYMVFESVTHLKIVTEAGKCTAISVFIAPGDTETEAFSFNFFDGGIYATK